MQAQSLVRSSATMHPSAGLAIASVNSGKTRCNVEAQYMKHRPGLSLTPSIPVAIMSDSYKATHAFQYPPCDQMVSYGEFRWGYDKDLKDRRMVHYGMRYVVEHYLHRSVSKQL
jgi:hypothetical protein